MFLAKLLYGITQAPGRPIRKVTLYYLSVGLIITAVVLALPAAGAYLAGYDGAFVGLGSGSDFLEPIEFGTDNVATHADVVITLLVALVGSLLMMIPVSWVYMGTRIKLGFDQSVVQTIIILPIAVAGVVTVVKTSIALAFSLAGIVAGVRFRNTIKETSDALYIFAAIGVGLACGVGAFSIAAAMSAFFCYVILILWHCDYGTCPYSGPMPGYSSGNILEAVEGEAGKKKSKKQRKSTGQGDQPKTRQD
jgi:hypothetical protein